MGSSGDSGHMHLHFEIRTSKSSTVSENRYGKHYLVATSNSTTLDPEKYIGSRPTVSAKVVNVNTNKVGSKETINIEFDKQIIIKKEPKLDLKIGDENVVATYKGKTSDKKGIIYELDYDKLEPFTSGTVVIKSLTGGNVVNEDDENCKVNLKISEKKIDEVKALSINNTFRSIFLYNRGDVNNDGEIDMRDAVYISRICSGNNKNVTEEQLTKADVDMNGKVEIKDVVYVSEYISKLGTQANNTAQLKDLIRYDFNNDNKINKDDYNLLLRKVTQKDNNYEEKYDFNNDGKISITDLVRFLQILKKYGSR